MNQLTDKARQLDQSLFNLSQIIDFQTTYIRNMSAISDILLFQIPGTKMAPSPR